MSLFLCSLLVGGLVACFLGIPSRRRQWPETFYDKARRERERVAAQVPPRDASGRFVKRDVEK